MVKWTVTVAIRWGAIQASDGRLDRFSSKSPSVSSAPAKTLRLAFGR